MRTPKLFLAFVFSCLYIFASGQYSATSSSALTYTSGSVNSSSSWNNLSFIQNGDNQYATSFISGTNKSTNEIDAVKWGFQSSNSGQLKFIPQNAIINGIEVTVRLKKSLYGNVRTNKITLLKAGKEINTNKATSTTWPSSATNFVYGSSVDAWGTTWSVGDLTNEGFGVRISARQKGKKDVEAEIDHIKITIYFNQTFFYSKSSGNLEQLNTWGSSPDGSGTVPVNFTSEGQVFFLRNRASSTLTENFNITGSNSKLVIGDGINATNLVIPSNYALGASVELASNSTLIITNTAVPVIANIAENSTVIYNAAGDQTVSSHPYYNLTISGGGNKFLAAHSSGLTVINNILTINSGATLNNQGNQVLVLGASNGIVNNGTATGTGKYTYEVLDGNTSILGTGTFSNLEINAELSNNGTSVISLSQPTTVTGTLTLSDGLFSNGNNLTMATGSNIKVVDGALGSNIVQSTAYNIVYAFETGTSKTTGSELSGSVRDVTVQIPSGSTLNLGTNLNVGRNLLISTGKLDVSSSNYNISVGGNLTNNGTLNTRNSTLTFNGSGLQTINGTTVQSLNNLTVNNAAGGRIQLNTPVNVSNELKLINGIVTSSSLNMLSLGNSASVTGGSNNSYISGPIRHTLAATSGTKVFPIGKSGLYKPAILVLHQNTSAPTTYTGEVFDGVPPTRTLPSTLERVSEVRYYTINSSDNSNLKSAVISLTYDMNDQISDYSSLRIAKSQGNEWINIEGMASSTTGAGIITSNSFYSFSDFVFAKVASSDLVNSVLPLTWVSFHAAKKQHSIELVWKTASEVNTSHFYIERSNDGASWKTIGSVKGKGREANEYSYIDLTPLPVNYYRIKQIDLDGKFGYSKVITFQNKVNNKQFAVQPNPVKGSSFQCFIPDEEILSSKEVIVRVYDISGKAIFSTKAAPAMYLAVDCSTFKPGMYVISIEGGNKIQQTKFIRQ